MKWSQPVKLSSRWDRLRALGAVADNPASVNDSAGARAGATAAALGLPACGYAEHTEVFVFNCPPYASAYLSGEGGLRGQDTDQIAGFWRILGRLVPDEPDHLAELLGLYASLGEAAEERDPPAAAETLTQLRQALFWEHLWPWLPAYLGAIRDLPAAALAPWAELTLQTLTQEHAPGELLPAALREAAPPVQANRGLDELISGLITPIRSGMILTRRAVVAGADQVDAGRRIGGRRSALRVMFSQEPERTASWLAGEAARWSRRHLAVAFGDQAQQWWAERAATTARALVGDWPVSATD
jgi:Nitrate reductase delta subunit